MDYLFADVPELGYHDADPGYVIAVELPVGVDYGIILADKQHYVDLKGGNVIFFLNKKYKVLGPFTEVIDYMVDKNKPVINDRSRQKTAFYVKSLSEKTKVNPRIRRIN
jgi:hypothetical protein